MQVLDYGKVVSDSFNNLSIGIERGRMARDLRQAKEKKELEQIRLAEAKSKAAEIYKSGDYDAMATLSLEYPELGQQLNQQMQFKNDRTKQNMIDTEIEILNNPDRTEEILTKRIEMVSAEGGDPSHSMRELEHYRADPEGYQNKVKFALAYQAPEAYNAWKDVNTAQPKYQSAGGGYVFDPTTGDLWMDESYKKDLQAKHQRELEILNSQQGASTAEPLKFSDVRGLNADVGKIVDPIIKTKDAIDGLKALGKNPTGADAIAAIFGFMKMHDPDSVVMEGEQRMAAATGGPFDQFVGNINNIVNGGKLTGKVLQQFIDTGIKIYNSKVNNASGTVNGLLDVYGDQLDKDTKSRLTGRIPAAYDVIAEDSVFAEPTVPVQTRSAQSGYGATAVNQANDNKVDNIMKQYGF